MAKDKPKTTDLDAPKPTGPTVAAKDTERNPIDGKPAVTGTRLREAPQLAEFYDQEEASSPYWIGVHPTSPRYNIILGGVNFPLETYEVRDGQAPGQTHRIPQKGCRMWLTDKQVERCVSDGAALIVRIQGNGENARRPVVDSRTVRYRRLRNDHPIGCYAFLIPWDEKGMTQDEPDPMYKMPEHVKPVVEKLVNAAREQNLATALS